MDNETYRFPVEVQVRKQNLGTLRSVKVLYEDSTAEFTDTQDWRLEALSVQSYVRKTLDIVQLDETAEVGYVDVNPGTLEWSFTPTDDSLVS